MNKKGFTLIEILSVIVLLGLLMSLAGIGVTRAQQKSKEKTLAAKVKNIEKAAVLYGQDFRNEFDDTCTIDGKTRECIKDLKVNILANDIKDESGNVIHEKYISTDISDVQGNKIINPVDESKNMNDCKITVYIKYNKIYAIYDKNQADSGDTKCWK